MLMNFYIKYSIAFSSEFIMESAKVLFGEKIKYSQSCYKDHLYAKTTCL